jgi:Delta3-Delta2-enoyl-CoA isomerase
MDSVIVEKQDNIAILKLSRGKVNALNGEVVKELREGLESLEADQDTRAVILTGQGKFFSFGFDIPQFLSFGKEQFSSFLSEFTQLYAYVFLYPKPIIAGLNGHTIAGGCMLALACDYRVMAQGKGKISLNEIGLGSSIFAGSTEMLRFWAGSGNATKVLYSGALYSAEEAMELGIVQETTSEEDLMAATIKAASDLASKDPKAFRSIKSLLRKPAAKEMKRRESESIEEFVDIWYSEPTWAKLRGVQIH